MAKTKKSTPAKPARLALKPKKTKPTTTLTISYEANSPVTLHHLHPKIRPLSAHDRDLAAEHGFEIRSGKFDPDEVTRLRKNFDRIKRRMVRRYGEKEAQRRIIAYLGVFTSVDPLGMDHDEYKTERLDFFMKLGKNLRNRSLHSLYIKVRDSMTGLTRASELNEEQIQQIIDYVRKKKKTPQAKVNFVNIAKEVNCTPKTAHLVAKARLTSEGEVASMETFTPAEDMQLLRTLMCMLDTTDFSQLLTARDVQWTLLAELMGTKRTGNQVMNRFHRVLKFRLQADLELKSQFTARQERWNLAKIIYFMQMEGYEDEKAIDWNLLQERFDYELSMRMLAQYWDEYLKLEVPDAYKMSHPQIVNYLVEKKLGSLVKMHKSKTIAKLEEFYKS